MRVLGIETSCDDTGVAVYDSERGLRAHKLNSQVETHRPYGGVVPELAARDHIRLLMPLVGEVLDEAGFDLVKIVASSGFGPAKCRVMAMVDAPVDVIGTGSFLPDRWEETYATADVIEYDGKPAVKAGREFLLPRK